MAYARLAAKHFHTRHHEYYVTPSDLVAAIPRVASQYDQPFGNSSAVPAYYCAKLAQDLGIDTLLAGDGGDELFGGNTRYAKQRVFAAYEQMPGWIRARIIHPILLGIPGTDRIPIVRKAASYVRQARIPMPERMQTYNLIERLGVHDVLEEGFLASIDLDRPLAHQRVVYAEHPEASMLNRMLAYDWQLTLADNDLPKVVGTSSMAGIGVRFPLLDDELVDFSIALPTRYKLNGLKLRHFFKESLRGFLPDEIIAKRKHGFGLPFGVWAARDAALHAFAVDALARLDAQGIVRAGFSRALLDVHLREHPGYYGEMVWILMMLSEWFRSRSAMPSEESEVAVG